MLYKQIENELEKVAYDYQFDEHDYDFFPCEIRSLKQITIVNYSSIKSQYKSLPSPLQKFFRDKAVASKTKKNKREGRFWKCNLTYKEIDLSRFMLFNKLGKEEAHLIERDNCFIYACAMAGLDEKVLSDLRFSIHKRSITTADIIRAAKECDLRVRVKQGNGEIYYIGNGTHKGYYEKGKDFSLRKVLLVLFEVNAFQPISAGDYMSFNSSSTK